ncbi:HNH endonuclease [Streptomyces sp. 150FB]|uniref:HNH endonuclease n=1 Tax=Streptomyces sp. 150FB TaxID=1576605 RepID=UPI001F377309|nr:HNH endonuclease [Streptomyces sp. 150FB]
MASETTPTQMVTARPDGKGGWDYSSTPYKGATTAKGGGSGNGGGSCSSHQGCGWSWSCHVSHIVHKAYQEVKRHPVIATVIATAVVIAVVVACTACVLAASAEAALAFTGAAEAGAGIGVATATAAAAGAAELGTSTVLAGVGAAALAETAVTTEKAEAGAAAGAQAAKAAADDASEAGAAGGAARAAESEPKSGSSPVGCGGHSFLPATPVLMADGETKPIKDVKAGDEVKATDPETGKSTDRTVEKLITTKDDKDFATVTIKGGKKTSKITATVNHPFWSTTTHRWIDAGDLKPHTGLRTATGASVAILAVHIWHHQHLTHDLTVNTTHTYYVLAGATPVLVHNCGGAITGHPATCDCANGGVPKVRNGKLAGDAHPKTSVPFDTNGFPDFSAWRHPQVPDVRIQLTGSRSKDFRLANQAAGLSSTPPGYTWHHNEDPGLMQLIERQIHADTGHTGGF